MLTKMEHWNIEKEESDKIVKAAEKVASHYPKLKVAPKIIDWCGLAGVLIAVNTPRILATKYELEERRRNGNVKHNTRSANSEATAD